MSIIATQKLTAELRRIRTDRQLTQGQVAADMDWSLSKVIRVENGAVKVSVSDLRSLLAYYGAQDRTDELVPLARAAKTSGRGWWAKYRDYIPAELIDRATIEAEATWVVAYAPVIVPDLLMTPAYAEAVYGDGDPRADFNLRRREALLEKGTELTFVLDESVLYRQPVAGRHVLAEQLEHIAADSRLFRATVLVLPYTAGLHEDTHEPFTAYNCNGHQMPVRGAADAIHDLTSHCLGIGESVEFISRAAAALR